MEAQDVTAAMATNDEKIAAVMHAIARRECKLRLDAQQEFAACREQLRRHLQEVALRAERKYSELERDDARLYNLREDLAMLHAKKREEEEEARAPAPPTAPRSPTHTHARTRPLHAPTRTHTHTPPSLSHPAPPPKLQATKREVEYRF